jgi:dCTP deaminase
VLPSQRLRALIAEGAIAAEVPVEAGQVQPASLDLRLGGFTVRVRASFLAGAGRSVEGRLPDFEMHRFTLEGGAVLEKGCVYLVPLMERLALPKPWQESPMRNPPPGGSTS